MRFSLYIIFLYLWTLSCKLCLFFCRDLWSTQYLNLWLPWKVRLTPQILLCRCSFSYVFINCVMFNRKCFCCKNIREFCVNINFELRRQHLKIYFNLRGLVQDKDKQNCRCDCGSLLCFLPFSSSTHRSVYYGIIKRDLLHRRNNFNSFSLPLHDSSSLQLRKNV